MTYALLCFMFASLGFVCGWAVRAYIAMMDEQALLQWHQKINKRGER